MTTSHFFLTLLNPCFLITLSLSQLQAIPTSDIFLNWKKLKEASQNTSKNDLSLQEEFFFLKKHPDLPLHETLLRTLERRAYASNQKDLSLPPPVSLCGALYLYKNKKAAPILLKKIWISDTNCTEEEQQIFANQFKEHLTKDDHIQRLKNIIYSKKVNYAHFILTFFSTTNQTRIRHMINLLNSSGQSSTSIEPLRASLCEESPLKPLTLFALIEYYKNSKKHEEALMLLKKTSIPPNDEHPIASFRLFYARYLVERQRFQEALVIIKKATSNDKETQADCLWMRGWILFSFLKKPDEAIAHFETLLTSSQSGITQSRACFWMARCFQTLNNQEKALHWYKKAAIHKTTFYGQQALFFLNKKGVTVPKEAPPLLQKRTDALWGDILFSIPPDEKKENIIAFISKAAQSVNCLEEARNLIKKTSQKWGASMAIWMSKKIGISTTLIPESYPTLPLDKTKIPISNSMLFSIIRQESRFDPLAKSSAGAMGLMQLMEKTASKERDVLKIKGPLTDSHTNMILGSHHFKRLLNDFDNNIVLSLCAYNAGKEATTTWTKSIGRPIEKDYTFDVDWIELIPYGETRNYVMRVLENIHSYEHIGISR